MSTSPDRRRELRSAYDERPTTAGVYLIRNTVTGRVFIGSSGDLVTVRNRLDFGQATASAGVLDLRMRPDALAHGMDAFRMETLDTLDMPPGTDPARARADLTALETLWREKLADLPQY